MEELRQASVELVGTADHMGCGIQHLLQFLGRSFRHTWLSGDLSDVGAADFCNAVHPVTVRVIVTSSTLQFLKWQPTPTSPRQL